MIATILPGSSNFHAVDYNERKVAKGVARLLEIKNFGALGEVRKPTPEELAQFLMEYSSMNPRIQKAQFHAPSPARATRCQKPSCLISRTSIFKKWLCRTRTTLAHLFPQRYRQCTPTHCYFESGARRSQDTA